MEKRFEKMGDVAANGTKNTDAELDLVPLVKKELKCLDVCLVGVVRSCWCIEGGVVELRHVAATAGNGLKLQLSAIAKLVVRLWHL
ncbi:hypothetical protein C5167_022239 [Papaver somniferum]|uniref:Uncharacterized protein n=1 Tax=Papaver somniferum TaxID=3469 RepID=A0A4Y7JKF4_PAPSO|nr:hypothetical protein C5167_022239 [Papaver somniferum]